jgi:predicted RNA polymerase sigma factor
MGCSRRGSARGSGRRSRAAADQDRRRWDQAHPLGSRSERQALQRTGPYTLQAAIAACHSRASSVEATDWRRIVLLYERLVDATGSPVIELNRAVAISMASGPEDGLRLVDALAEAGTLDRYHLFHSVRGDLLERLGRDAEAADAFAPPRSQATTLSALVREPSRASAARA